MCVRFCFVFLAISTFSPVGKLSSNGLRVRVCVRVLVYSTGIEQITDMWTCQRSAYFNPIPSTHARARAHTHTHTHTHILIPFEDREPTGLKVDIAYNLYRARQRDREPECVCGGGGGEAVWRMDPIKLQKCFASRIDSNIFPLLPVLHYGNKCFWDQGTHSILLLINSQKNIPPPKSWETDIPLRRQR